MMDQSLELEERSFRALGTDVQLSIACKEAELPLARRILERAEAECFRLQSVFNRFDPESELSRVNADPGLEQVVSGDLVAVAERSLRAYRETGGLFDPRILSALEAYGYAGDFFTSDFSVPATTEVEVSKRPLEEDMVVGNGRVRFASRMDFSGIAKGYIVDRLAAFLRGDGWGNVLVDAGGDLFAAGVNPSGTPWRISIEGIPTESLLIPLSEQALATSGVTRRHWESGGRSYHHLVSPRDPTRFDFSISTVTVLADTTTDAEVKAKEYFFLGRSDGLRLADERGDGIVYLFPDGSFAVSKTLQKAVQ
jgi:thiamine biosynthesis lipoprotein